MTNDIKKLFSLPEKILEILLINRTTRTNICWATNHYGYLGKEYYPQQPITIDLIIGKNNNLIRPRVYKNTNEKLKRTKDKAEVYTPSWICNMQNNIIDEKWFERKNVFNVVVENDWIVNNQPIIFSNDKNWRKYIDARRLEVSCGEAPYLVSRYDTVTGDDIPIKKRIGLLDRKLRVINENTITEEEWYYWVKRAYESTYGFEYQGDSLLIARHNLLFTFSEYMKSKYNHEPSLEQLKEIARIISWNIWQMDGVTYNVPYSERPKVNSQISMFEIMDGTVENNMEPVPAKIYDWRANKSVEFKKMIRGVD